MLTQLITKFLANLFPRGYRGLAKEIEQAQINRMTQEVWDEMKGSDKRKIKDFSKDMANAIAGWVMQQEFNITHMDAPVSINKKNPWLPKIPFGLNQQYLFGMGPVVNKLVTITATGPQKPLNYAGGMSITPVAIEDHIGRAQISEKKDNIGPAAAGQVYGQVMKSKVKLLKPKKI